MSRPLRPILLAEDDDLDAELTLRAFERSRLANPLKRVGDGLEAMEHLAACLRGEAILPAVVLLDIKMPRLDGLATLQAIKTDPKLRHLPVVMLTSSREHGDLLHSYNQGVNAYIVKPVGQQALLEAVQALGLFWGVLNCLPDNESS
ncbi:response regulator [Chitinimonas sp.]|uniref:response regulator n=1 Tax=Chitinimonas sp. TaxID=1934313 RepID=UPI002F938EF9